jgi:hypothetical protein
VTTQFEFRLAVTGGRQRRLVGGVFPLSGAGPRPAIPEINPPGPSSKKQASQHPSYEPAYGRLCFIQHCRYQTKHKSEQVLDRKLIFS